MSKKKKSKSSAAEEIRKEIKRENIIAMAEDEPLEKIKHKKQARGLKAFLEFISNTSGRMEKR